MGKKDKSIDSYISKSADFAKPILNHLRDLVHKVCSDVEEGMKWSFPHFNYSGAILCSMASFKEHCSFGFWKATLMKDPDKLLNKVGETSMGSFGKLKSLKDLPSDKLITKYIKEAMRLNEEDIKVEKAKPLAKKDLKIPAYLTNSLKKNKKAWSTFDGFSPSHKREYVEWIVEAKTEETRQRRIGQAIEWLSEGKARNWKYMK
jgi:uncharacterized protein YdeI (YjbR/CyaY-like superfamily)